MLSPLYGYIDAKEHSLARRLTKLEHEIDGETVACEMWTGRTITGSELVFVGHEELFAQAESIAAGSKADVAKRCAAFVQSALTLLERNEQDWEAVHAHGWLGAAVVAALKAKGLSTRCVLTVHDTEDVPEFDAAQAKVIGLPKAGSPMAQGLAAADAVTVASTSMDLGVFGFDGQVTSVRNGVDGARWNPLTDPELPRRFDPVDIDAKAQCKKALQEELGFPQRAEVPLLLVIGRDGQGHGLDLLAQSTSMLLRNDVQLAVYVLGDASSETTETFEELSERWPDRCQLRTNIDAGQHHRAMGGADLLLLPARRAEAPDQVLIAQRYGVAPVALRDGAFAEVIVDADAKLHTGSGFLFDDASADAVLAGARRGIAAFARGEDFDELRRRVMRLDVSWDRSARIYDRLYTEGLSTEEKVMEAES